MKRILITFGLVVLASPAWASHSPGNASAVEASMDVSGSITVSPKGYVIGYKLDQPEKLPAYVVNMLNRAIPKWRFQPNVRHGHPIIIKASMDIRLVARPIPDHKYSISIDQTTFGTGHENDDYNVRTKGKLTPPPYPLEAEQYSVSGTVFLILRIDRQGHVAKAAVDQVDLGTRGQPNLMVRWRREFAAAALDGAHKWQFLVPTEGKLASAEHWDIEIPVAFQLSGKYADRYAYGKWQPYLPGPAQYIPWANGSELAAHAKPPVGDGPHILGTGLHRIEKPKS